MRNDQPPADTTAAFERALAALDSERYVFRLYVAGDAVHSQKAVRNVKLDCDGHLRDRVDLEIVDLLLDPGAVTDDLVLATPTLIRRLPQPFRTVVGDLSEMEKVLVGLSLTPEG